MIRTLLGSALMLVALAFWGCSDLSRWRHLHERAISDSDPAHELSTDHPIELHFIDVGEGDATLIRLDEERVFLVDTGNLASAPRITSHLAAHAIERLHTLLLTHPHLDHIGGAFSLAQSVSVGTVIDNGEDLTDAAASNDAYRWYGDLIRRDSRYRRAAHGDVLDCGVANCTILGGTVVDPTTRDWNSNSLVLFIRYGEFKALLMGDGNRLTERWLLENVAEVNLAGVKLLKAGHHGAADTAEPRFVKVTQPELAIVSVNRGNIRGYPAPETIQKYQRNGAEVLSTAELGTIIVRGWRDGRIEVEVDPMRGRDISR